MSLSGSGDVVVGGVGGADVAKPLLMLLGKNG